VNTPRPPVLEAKNLVKRYGSVTAISGADFELRAGEVLAVIGDNGAGKSSLIKALSGALMPDSGEILMDGELVRFRTALDARRRGIETVYQDLAVIPALDIASNVFLGREVRKRGVLGSIFRQLDKPRMRAEAMGTWRTCRSASRPPPKRWRPCLAASVKVWQSCGRPPSANGSSSWTSRLRHWV